MHYTAHVFVHGGREAGSFGVDADDSKGLEKLVKDFLAEGFWMEVVPAEEYVWLPASEVTCIQILHDEP